MSLRSLLICNSHSISPPSSCQLEIFGNGFHLCVSLACFVVCRGVILLLIFLWIMVRVWLQSFSVTYLYIIINFPNFQKGGIISELFSFHNFRTPSPVVFVNSSVGICPHGSLACQFRVSLPGLCWPLQTLPLSSPSKGVSAPSLHQCPSPIGALALLWLLVGPLRFLDLSGNLCFLLRPRTQLLCPVLCVSTHSCFKVCEIRVI